MVLLMMAREFSKLELNAPFPLEIDGVGHIRCPTVQDITKCRVHITDSAVLYAEDAYNYYLELLVISKAKVLERYSPVFEEDVLEKLDKLSLFCVLILIPDLREQLTKTFNFFFEEDVVFDLDTNAFRVFHEYSEEVGVICNDNFIDVRNLILKRVHISPPKVVDGKRRSKKMIEFDKKIEAGRKHSRRYQIDQAAMEIGNIVSKVASKANAADINDVYGWTIYQLYEQFSEINVGIQIDTILKRWSTWGKDDFDFSVWYKPNNSD